MELPVEAQHTEVVMSLHERETTEVECLRCHGTQVE